MAGGLAVAAGACVVEKHLTYDRSAAGPDHAASFDREQFGRYVAGIRLAERMRGGGGKRVLECERDVRRVSRQSLVARRDLPAGHTLSEADLVVQRPGTGVSAAEFPGVLGRRLARSIGRGTMIQHEMI
jgi:N,N'-diacetyllegionaminate synthase